MKNCEGWLELSLSQLSLDVADWDGMDMWWGNEMRTGWINLWSLELNAEDRLEGQEGHECRSGYGRTWDWQRRCPWQKEMEKECYEQEVQSYRKTDYKPTIIAFFFTLQYFQYINVNNNTLWRYSKLLFWCILLGYNVQQHIQLFRRA